MIFVASDHAGFELRKEIINYFKSQKIKVKDLGAKMLNQDDDYPDFALSLAKQVAKKPSYLGILICRNGIGMSITANKVKGIRAGLCTSVGQAVTGRAHDNCNILCLASDYVSSEQNMTIVKTFLKAEFSQEKRHKRRLKKIETFERSQK